MVPPVRTPTELTNAFRAQGLKVTPQRQLLFRLLHDNEAHPSAEALFAVASEQMPGISLRTVYQTLNDLVAMGELRQLTLGGGSSRFDPNVGDHHHLVCSSCGDVRDVSVRGSGPTASQLDGFTVETTDIIFRGLCASCATAERSNTTTNTPSTRSQQ
jgi:Fe2+ or Zn2+ uptake regulation protein